MTNDIRIETFWELCRKRGPGKSGFGKAWMTSAGVARRMANLRASLASVAS